MARARARTSAELPRSLAPRTLFVTGKGGVGKSTVAAALSLAFRDAGVRTLLVEIAGQASAAALVSAREVRYEPTALSPGLWALRIDPDNALREYARLRLKVKAVADRAVGNPIFQQFAQAAPGFRELLVLGKLWQLAELRTSRNRPRFEAIVVDAPATGHGLGLLGMAGVVARMFPVGPIAAEAREVDAFIRDPQRAGVVLVALAEEMPVNETIELSEKLGEQGVDVATVVLNALVRSRFSDDDVLAMQRAAGASRSGRAARAALTTALYEAERCRQQREERARLEEALGPVSVLPYLYAQDLGADHVADLARWLTPKGQRALAAEAERAMTRRKAARR